MPKFMIGGTVTVSCYTEVEADTIEEARELAEDRELASLCADPYADIIEESWHLDTDGMPTILEDE